MIRWAGRATAAWARPRADLVIAENLCLRQQLIVLQRRAPRPRLRDGDRRFWILVCRWFLRWRDSRRPTEHRASLASPGMDGVLAVAVPATERGAGGLPCRGPYGAVPIELDRERVDDALHASHGLGDRFGAYPLVRRRDGAAQGDDPAAAAHAEPRQVRDGC